jgi:hypothetical protein
MYSGTRRTQRDADVEAEAEADANVHGQVETMVRLVRESHHRRQSYDPGAPGPQARHARRRTRLRPASRSNKECRMPPCLLPYILYT